MKPGNLKSLPAARVLAQNHIVSPQHIGPGLGEAKTVLLIRPAAKRLLLGPHQPANLIGFRLTAVKAGKGGWLQGFALIKKISLLHKPIIVALSAAERQALCDVPGHSNYSDCTRRR